MKQISSLFVAVILLLSLCACTQSAEAQWQQQYDLGVRYLSEGNYEEAIIAFTAAIEINPKQADAYIGVSEAYMEIGNTGAAISILEEGLAETNSEEIKNRLDKINSVNNNESESAVRELPLTYQMLDSGGIVPEVENIHYEVNTINDEIDREINTYTSIWRNGTNEITLFGEVVVDLLPQQYSGSYYINTYFSENETSQRVEECTQYIYGVENGQFSNYEEMLQIYGNNDRAGGNTSLWLESNEWYIGVQVFNKTGEQMGYAFFSLGTDEEIQNIKEFAVLRIP